jgi:hypothetical protein
MWNTRSGSPAEIAKVKEVLDKFAILNLNKKGLT